PEPRGRPTPRRVVTVPGGLTPARVRALGHDAGPYRAQPRRLAPEGPSEAPRTHPCNGGRPVSSDTGRAARDATHPRPRGDGRAPLGRVRRRPVDRPRPR